MHYEEHRRKYPRTSTNVFWFFRPGDFLVPFVWGFSARWLPVFLGLRPVRRTVLLLAVALNSAAVLAAFAGWMMAVSLVLVVGLMTAL